MGICTSCCNNGGKSKIGSSSDIEKLHERKVAENIKSEKRSMQNGKPKVQGIGQNNVSNHDTFRNGSLDDTVPYVHLPYSDEFSANDITIHEESYRSNPSSEGKLSHWIH